MTNPWASLRLRSFRDRGKPGLPFGFMHEDPAAERELFPGQGAVICVLSAGDIAFALANSQASRVVAADVNPTQHALVRLKLALAEQGWTLATARKKTVREGLAAAGGSSWLTPETASRLQRARVLDRSLTSAGDVDARLSFLARWMVRFIIPAGALDHKQTERAISSIRWKFAWLTMGLQLRMMFPASLRRHLPANISATLRRRMGAALRAPQAHDNPWLQRLMRPSGWLDEKSLASTWPDLKGTDPGGLELYEGALKEAIHNGTYDLMATSNIFDTTPREALNEFLQQIESHARTGSRVVVRSLFREAADWLNPPKGWHVDSESLQRVSALDRSPLCRVSVVIMRDSG